LFVSLSFSFSTINTLSPDAPDELQIVSSHKTPPRIFFFAAARRKRTKKERKKERK
jgi:hypothetical protein